MSGVYVSSYEIFPYDVMKDLKNDYLDPKSSNLIYYEDDIESIIHLDNDSSIEKTKEISFENMKKAVTYASVMASFCVEEFGTKGVENIKQEEKHIT